MHEMPSYILALDQGTTSSRAILFNRTGSLIATGQREFPQIYPRNGWVEHDPAAIWESQLESAKEAIARAQITAGQIDSIGISNQRETVLVWERDSGKPVHNAIVWQCRRSAAICRDLKDRGLEDMIRARTGLLIDPYFSATKLMWLLAEFPDLRSRAERGELLFGTVDSWLVWQLSGTHATDVTNASRTLLFNIHTMDWDDELLSLFRIPRAMLPTVHDSSGLIAHTKPELFGRAIPISSCVGDQQAALFGHACFEPGMVKNTYGTGCFTLLNTGNTAVASKNRLLTTVAWRIKGKTSYALEGSVFVGGAVIQWLRDELKILSNAAESEAIARSVPDTGGVVIVPAFVGLGAPWWDSEARGLILGLGRGSGRAHIVRAALESIAWQTRDLVAAMESDYGQPVALLKADGGAAANSFLMQYQADITGCSVILPEVHEITALGAAYLAGLATGYWHDQDEIARNWRERRRFSCTLGDDDRSSLLARWHKAIALAREAGAI